MADAEIADANDAETAPKKSLKMPIIIGLVLAILGGAGGYFAVQMGLLFGREDETAQTEEAPFEALPDIAFVPVDPLVISLNENGTNRYLKFRAQLEVRGPAADDVQQLMPRVVDVLNNYLRAVDVALLSETSALVGLRAQMLRRVQVVVGHGRVRDLLIMEFVLN
ncbi:flagellar basal body-associated protein FliL [Cognatishimia sp. MH4019]|uniref:flagellar basal body-associated FliL family protein n=1 Tax=Cognatishimia sp. MH4019 TaxID=2854030 RepID=UPI001CD56434|nr:flagellar basal body-associated FliL family protein [Cognatishimia sp. MH4019]